MQERNIALLNALKNGDVSALKAALDKGADPNTIDENCNIGGHKVCYALHHAVWVNSYECVRILIDAGASINVFTGGATVNRDTPLHWAAAHAADTRILELLLHRGAKHTINHANSYPHESAIALNRSERVRFIIETMNTIDGGLRQSCNILNEKCEKLLNERPPEQPTKISTNIPTDPLVNSSTNMKIRERQLNLNKEELEKARQYYAEGKATFYRKDTTNAIKFFQLAKDKYKDALDVPGIDQKDKAKIESRLAKLRNPDGKYSPIKLIK